MLSSTRQYEPLALESLELEDTTSQSRITRRQIPYSNPEHVPLVDLIDLTKSQTPKSNETDGTKGSPKGFSIGWRAGVKMCAVVTLCILILNLSVGISLVIKSGTQQGISTVFEGNCRTSATWDRWCHLAINTLSSILLACSNYCMQRLSAPTRREIDKAHEEKSWLDVGVLSLRNLRAIPYTTLSVWILLAMTSIPLHLLYNSIIFQSLPLNKYTAVLVSTTFLQGGKWNDSALPAGSIETESGIIEKSNDWLVQLQSNLLANNASNPNASMTGWTRLPNDICLFSYSEALVSDRGNVLMITKDTRQMDNSVFYLDFVDPLEVRTVPGSSAPTWICDWTDECDLSTLTDIRDDPFENWHSSEHYVLDCLSENVEQTCKIRLSVVILIVVVICNACKAFCMLLALLTKDQPPLLTIGDAITSFLSVPDKTTALMCLVDKTEVMQSGHVYSSRPTVWRERRVRWLNAPSLGLWVSFTILCLTIFVVACTCLALELHNMKNYGYSTGLKTVWDAGLHSLNSASLATRSTSFMHSVLLANSPQLLVSFLYLLYNSLFTSMLLAREWSSYGLYRSPLRVSEPRGFQRSSYWLQVPYKIAVPLIAASALLHWLVSQSIFVSSIAVYLDGKEEPGSNVYAYGYSLIAIIGVMILMILMLIAGGIAAWRRFPDSYGPPLAGSCSIVISAACHPLNDKSDAAERPLRWGAVYSAGEEVGHCFFSSSSVEMPVSGQLYI